MECSPLFFYVSTYVNRQALDKKTIPQNHSLSKKHEKNQSRENFLPFTKVIYDEESVKRQCERSEWWHMDNELIGKILDGDKHAYRVLYDKYVDNAIRTATAITRNREFAKDAVQETFIRVYKNLNKYNPEQPFEPWFYRILTNECNRILKKESKITLINNYDQESRLSEESKESLIDLYDSIQSLKDKYRIPLLLKYLKGFKEKEIAEILDMNVNTVKTRLFKGRNMLKKVLQPIEDGVNHHE